ncbi:MAG: hypothetical protein COB66_04875 [Coxiella sp. (in: Bacteria)]|nr:MAG: hypothetical protein COB66_04875 [Coxiella sp. (in: g-proteobacteria)]
MSQNQDKDHPLYRITDIEYTNDGSCYVGVQMSVHQDSHQFKLSNFCHRLSWLRNFHQPDLGSIWQLTKRQETVSPLKRVISFMMIKLCALELRLCGWEEEAKTYMMGHGSDFDDW